MCLRKIFCEGSRRMGCNRSFFPEVLNQCRFAESFPCVQGRHAKASNFYRTGFKENTSNVN